MSNSSKKETWADGISGSQGKLSMLRATSMMMVVFLDVAPCSLVDRVVMMKPLSSSKTSVNTYQTTTSQKTAIFEMQDLQV
jgi:hypothetical protein